MSRGTARAARPVAVWLAVSAVALASAAAVPGAWRTVADRDGRPGAEVDLLVAVCATGLAVSLAWLWAITTATVVGVVVGSGRPAAPRGVTRRLVLLACGVAAAAGSGTPALAADEDVATLLAGLPMPERAVAPDAGTVPRTDVRPAGRPAPATTGRTYVVRPGDSLWSIADAHPEPGTSGSVPERWHAIWQANRDVVGDDPDLIHPGQALRLPGPQHPDRHQPRAPKDGDR
ncbi:LysM peptidoglycan-binding domain-containing protein [Nocardioides sp. S5]|uniref:LysM peptidoglycan-binding domain-containing protein n=1 Tax=Nocardioides sp. S5 TaxID=2017486 RepID=UPI001A8FC790|nr:LysM peptidoglycan-binding domain-containing protein [Nocardioides sp. S5]